MFWQRFKGGQRRGKALQWEKGRLQVCRDRRCWHQKAAGGLTGSGAPYVVGQGYRQLSLVDLKWKAGIKTGEIVSH